MASSIPPVPPESSQAWDMAREAAGLACQVGSLAWRATTCAVRALTSTTCEAAAALAARQEAVQQRVMIANGGAEPPRAEEREVSLPQSKSQKRRGIQPEIAVVLEPPIPVSEQFVVKLVKVKGAPKEEKAVLVTGPEDRA